MAQRFFYPEAFPHAGRVSIANGSSVATFSEVSLAGRDWAGASLTIHPDSPALPYLASYIAEATPVQGVYDNLSLPLPVPFSGPSIVNAKFQLKLGDGATDVATIAAFNMKMAANFAQNLGMFGDLGDLSSTDYSILKNNTVIYDEPNELLLRWRNGVLANLIIAASHVEFSASWTLGFGSNELLMARVFATPVKIPANFAGSQGIAFDPAAADSVWNVFKNDDQFGTVTWPLGTTVPVFICPETNIATGDVFKVFSATSPDATLANAGLTFVGSRYSPEI